MLSGIKIQSVQDARQKSVSCQNVAEADFCDLFYTETSSSMCLKMNS